MKLNRESGPSSYCMQFDMNANKNVQIKTNKYLFLCFSRISILVRHILFANEHKYFLVHEHGFLKIALTRTEYLVGILWIPEFYVSFSRDQKFKLDWRYGSVITNTCPENLGSIFSTPHGSFTKNL